MYVRCVGRPTLFLKSCCVRMCFQATQKGDPVTILKKQLEEREKQLAAEQEDTSAAKNRLRELTKVSRTRVSQVNKATGGAK